MEVSLNNQEKAPLGLIRGTVLVISDEEIIRSTIKLYLEYIGYVVVTASNGREGLRTLIIYVDEVIAIVVDLPMPNTDGIEVIVKLRSVVSTVPVILCSGHNVEYTVQDLQGHQPAGFLQIPFSLNLLARTLLEMLGHSRAYSETSTELAEGTRLRGKL